MNDRTKTWPPGMGSEAEYEATYKTADLDVEALMIGEDSASGISRDRYRLHMHEHCISIGAFTSLRGLLLSTDKRLDTESACLDWMEMLEPKSGHLACYGGLYDMMDGNGHFTHGSSNVYSYRSASRGSRAISRRFCFLILMDWMHAFGTCRRSGPATTPGRFDETAFGLKSAIETRILRDGRQHFVLYRLRTICIRVKSAVCELLRGRDAA